MIAAKIEILSKNGAAHGCGQVNYVVIANEATCRSR